MLKALHFYPSISTLGGVESVLKHHARVDEIYGIESIIIVGCERSESISQLSMGKVRTLGVRGWNTLNQLRQRFAMVIHDFDPDVVVYHNLWACRHLADIDTRALRIGMLHTDSDVSRNALKKCATILDGLICVSPQIAELATKYIDQNRISTINYPINPPDLPPPLHLPLSGREIAIGFCGRLVIEQKRVDRLESICSFLKKSGISYRLDLLGEGSEMEELKSGLGRRFPVNFLGRKQGADYWNTIRSWDFILFCSDYEGTPISLLESLSQAVIPIYPRIQSGGDDYVSKVDQSLLFDVSDLSNPSTIIQKITATGPLETANLRSRCRESVMQNSLENYLSDFSKALEQFQSIKPRKKRRNKSFISRIKRVVPMFVIRILSPHLIY